MSTKYDSLNRLISLGLDRHWRRQTIQLAQFRPGSQILDMGPQWRYESGCYEICSRIPTETRHSEPQ
ncbi:class I SAM-dependent methyltransferase [bacterium]|nr:class I SAM-dependent methyltransferase [bacterium]